MLDALYPWLKALHVAAVISWMAGLFYLPRLFVYHSQTRPGAESSELFKTMERKLATVIMGPAMGVTWLAGLGLVHFIDIAEPWAIIKAASVIAMTAFHVWLTRFIKQFARDERPKSESFFRAANEIPTVLMLVIVVMVLVKPFS
jgi:protoporphyrinogen IX oxidase